MKWLRHLFQRKIILDANIILRYLLCDDMEKAIRARNIIRENRCVVYLEVLSEVVFVLQSPKTYNVPREEIAKQIVLLAEDIIIDKKEVLFEALNAYVGQPKIDFVDCILYGYAKKGYNVATFDEKLRKAIGR